MEDEFQFRSMEEIRAYIKKEVREQVESQRKKKRAWHVAKYALYLTLLTVAYLEYYLLDTMRQVLTLPTLQVNVPVKMNVPMKRI